jgi:hypothetical protein
LIAAGDHPHPKSQSETRLISRHAIGAAQTKGQTRLAPGLACSCSACRLLRWNDPWLIGAYFTVI